MIDAGILVADTTFLYDCLTFVIRRENFITQMSDHNNTKNSAITHNAHQTTSISCATSRRAPVNISKMCNINT